jgi:hypothetical protein
MNENHVIAVDVVSEPGIIMSRELMVFRIVHIPPLD